MYMQRLLTYCCLSLFCFNAASQKTIDVDKEPGRTGGAVNYLYTVAGTPFITAKFARVVEGSPFFNEQMMRGAIILSEGKEYKNILVRLNLLETQVNYLSEKEVEMIASTPIREVVVWDTIFNNDHRFIFSDYIETTDKPERDFYELLQTGKAELYKQYKKRILENRPYGSATVEQTVQTTLRYYVLLNGKWIKLNKLKELPTVFSDKKEEIAKFINDKKLSGDNEKNFEAVVTFYNSIVSKP
jgi:DNA-binding PadR family transcriptional regulator